MKRGNFGSDRGAITAQAANSKILTLIQAPSAHMENTLLFGDVYSELEHANVGEIIASGQHDVTLDDRNYEAISKPMSVRV